MINNMERNKIYNVQEKNDIVVMNTAYFTIIGWLAILVSLAFNICIYLLVRSDYTLLSWGEYVAASIMKYESTAFNIVLFFIVCFFTALIAMLINELVNGILYIFTTKNTYKTVHVGIIRAPFLFFVNCEEKMTVSEYKIISLLSIVLVGGVSALLAPIFDSLLLSLFSICAISLNGVRYYNVWCLRKENKNDEIILLPTGNGYKIYRNHTNN